MSVEVIICDFPGRRVVWTIAAEAVQRLRPKRSTEPAGHIPDCLVGYDADELSIACFAAPSFHEGIRFCQPCLTRSWPNIGETNAPS